MKHAFTALDKFTRRHGARAIVEFMDDVQQVYTGDRTYAQLAVKWGYISKAGKPVRKLVWDLAMELFELRIVPRPSTVDALAGMLREQEQHVEEIRERHATITARSNVFRLEQSAL